VRQNVCLLFDAIDSEKYLV